MRQRHIYPCENELKLIINCLKDRDLLMIIQQFIFKFCFSVKYCSSLPRFSGDYNAVMRTKNSNFLCISRLLFRKFSNITISIYYFIVSEYLCSSSRFFSKFLSSEQKLLFCQISIHWKSRKVDFPQRAYFIRFSFKRCFRL